MTIPLRLTAFAVGTILSVPAHGQAMDHSQHKGMAMPAPTPTPTPAPAPAPTPARTRASPSASPMAMDHSQHTPATPPPPPPATDDHAAMGHAMPDMQNMPGMSHNHGAMRMGDAGAAFGSGTALVPLDGGMMTGAMFGSGDWAFMAHGYLWGVATDQSGPRGDDMAFVQSMAMLTADRDLSPTTHLQLRSMFSLEPLMGRRGYPNLVATGETAFGQPLVDRQHPHDLFMELAARVDVEIAPDMRAFLYGGPVAEPALGPSAFMHRRSSRYLPLAPITHHWFDSTHITYGVVTAGLRATTFQLEASAFRGREPDEERWDIETPKLDSWSVRASWTPTPNWSAQVSHGRLKEPEALHPGEDEARTTASVQYGSRGLSATVAFSAKDRVRGPVLTAWLGEANWSIDRHHTLFGRVENVANDELFPEGDPLHDITFRVTRFEGGYAYRLPLGGPLELAVGGSAFGIAKPAALDAAYGSPVGYTLFAKLSLGQ